MAGRSVTRSLDPEHLQGQITELHLNKLKMVEEELDETLYWLELLVEPRPAKPDLLKDLMNENPELFKIIVSSINTMKKKINSR